MDFSSMMNSLKLHMLPDSLVNTQWREGYFTDEADIPPEMDIELGFVDIPHHLETFAKEIFSSVEMGTVQDWSHLVQEGLDFKRHLYFIHHLMCRAIANLDMVDRLRNGIFAARLYFSFLATPNRSPFLIYQSNIYKKALQILQCGGELKAEVKTALQDLIKALLMSDFGQDGDAVLLTVEALSNIAMQEIEEPDLLAQGIISYPQHRSLAMNALHGLMTLFSDKHGDIEETARLVMRFAFEALMLEFKKDLKDVRMNYVRKVFRDFILIVSSTLGQSAHKAVCILVQQLCLLSPDRAESRLKLVETVTSFVVKLPLVFCMKTCFIIIILSCHEKASVRLFSMEVLGRILCALCCIIDSPDETGDRLHKLIFTSVLARVEDSGSMVRSRAMACLIEYIKESSNNAMSRHLLKSIFVDPYVNHSLEEVPRKRFKDWNKVAQVLQEEEELPAVIHIPCAQTIVDLLTKFCSDGKVVVKRQALQLLVHICYLNVRFMNKEILAEIGSHCRDIAVSVRKAMIHEFTNLLLTYPTHQLLIKQWTMDVVPSIFDAEASVVEKVMESLKKAILDNMVPLTQLHSPKHHLPWVLMSEIAHLQLNNAFLKACSLWEEGTLKSDHLIMILISHVGIGKPHNNAAWEMLRCLAEFMTIKKPKFVFDFYHDEICGSSNVDIFTSHLVMEVLWLTYKQLPEESRSRLTHELNSDLNSFNVPVPLISRAVDIHYGLHVSNKEGFDVSNPPDWATHLIKKCEEGIFELLKSNNVEIPDEEALKRFAITLSNICLYYPKVVEKRTVVQLMLLLCPPEEGEQSEYRQGSCGADLQAALIIALGKIGLQNEELAKKLIADLGKLLSTTKESNTKNNIMICLTDLCIRYTSLGDELLPDMCVCLKDSLQPLRQNTLKLLVQLLQEDYIKMRNNLTFHLLSMLNDEDYTIVNMTRVFFVESVLKKKKNCFAISCVSAIFHYNRCERRSHRSSEVPLTNLEREVFDLSGPQNRTDRQNIYSFMLTHSSDDHRLGISADLCMVFRMFSDGKIELDEKGKEVLIDCLHVVDCDEMYSVEIRDEDDEEDPADEVDATRSKICAEVMKKHVMETAIPDLSKLKIKLVTLRSPLVSHIKRVLSNLITNHKIDIDDLNDSQLMNDLRREAIISADEDSDE